MERLTWSHAAACQQCLHMLASMLAAFCTHPVRSKLRRFHPSASLCPYGCDTFSTHYTDSVTTKLQEAVSSVSTIQRTCAAAVLLSRFGYCESTDVISRHHPDLNPKYQTCLIWSGWPRFVCEQIRRCKFRSLSASHYQIIRAWTSGPVEVLDKIFAPILGRGKSGLNRAKNPVVWARLKTTIRDFMLTLIKLSYIGFSCGICYSGACLAIPPTSYAPLCLAQYVFSSVLKCILSLPG